ncbi:MAG: GDP-L-fucose synthase [Nanoarchaeota archaeon]|nr:GDP-L-fucose synthase [archaeon]
MSAKDFWNGKKVLVTGAHGFLGKSLVPLLESKKASLILLRGSECDLRAREDVEKLFKNAKPEIVIHLAAHGGGIGHMRANPGLIYYDNITMNTNVVEACRVFGAKKFVGIGTVCSYPKYTPVPFKEEDLWNGYPEETNAPYGLAKKMMLVQTEAYHAQYGMNGIHLLFVNMYGPNDDFNLESSHVIPALIRKFFEAKQNGLKSVVLWGTGNASREFLYVEDGAKAIMLAAEQYNSSAPVNIGSGTEITIKDLAHKIAGLVGYKGEITWDASKPDGQPRRYLDVSRAKKEFGFSAETDFNEGLKKTIEWYYKNMK